MPSSEEVRIGCGFWMALSTRSTPTHSPRRLATLSWAAWASCSAAAICASRSAHAQQIAIGVADGGGDAGERIEVDRGDMVGGDDARAQVQCVYALGLHVIALHQSPGVELAHDIFAGREVARGRAEIYGDNLADCVAGETHGARSAARRGDRGHWRAAAVEVDADRYAAGHVIGPALRVSVVTPASFWMAPNHRRATMAFIPGCRCN